VCKAWQSGTDWPGAFTLLFLQLGTLYAWGVFQAELANQRLGNSVVLSSIGGVSGFCTALGCLPVSIDTLTSLLRAGNIDRIPFWSSQVGSGISPRCCLVPPLVQLLDQKCSGSDTGAWNRAWISERSWLYCKITSRSDVADVLDSLHHTESILSETERTIDWVGIMWSGYRGSISGTRGSPSYSIFMLKPQIAQKTISVWGLPWTFRFLAGMMLIIGTVRLRCAIGGSCLILSPQHWS